MNIVLDVRLKNETGVGRYIRNLMKWLPRIDTSHTYAFFDSQTHWHTFREQWSVPLELRKFSPDLVHFPYFNVPIFYNKPYVVTIHDLIIDQYKTGKAITTN